MAQRARSDTSARITVQCRTGRGLQQVSFERSVAEKHSKTLNEVLKVSDPFLNVHSVREEVYFSRELARVLELYQAWLTTGLLKLQDKDRGSEIVLIFDLYDFALLTGTPQLRKVLTDYYLAQVNACVATGSIFPGPSLTDIEYLNNKNLTRCSEDKLLQMEESKLKSLRLQYESALRMQASDHADYLEKGIIQACKASIRKLKSARRGLYPLLVIHHLRDPRFEVDLSPDLFARDVAVYLWQTTLKHLPKVQLSPPHFYDEEVLQIVEAERRSQGEATTAPEAGPVPPSSLTGSERQERPVAYEQPSNLVSNTLTAPLPATQPRSWKPPVGRLPEPSVSQTPPVSKSASVVSPAPTAGPPGSASKHQPSRLILPRTPLPLPAPLPGPDLPEAHAMHPPPAPKPTSAPSSVASGQGLTMRGSLGLSQSILGFPQRESGFTEMNMDRTSFLPGVSYQQHRSMQLPPVQQQTSAPQSYTPSSPHRSMLLPPVQQHSSVQLPPIQQQTSAPQSYTPSSPLKRAGAESQESRPEAAKRTKSDVHNVLHQQESGEGKSGEDKTGDGKTGEEKTGEEKTSEDKGEDNEKS